MSRTITKAPEDMTLEELEKELPVARNAYRTAKNNMDALSDTVGALTREHYEDEESEYRSHLENVEEQLARRRQDAGWLPPEDVGAGLRDLCSTPDRVIGAAP